MSILPAMGKLRACGAGLMICMAVLTTHRGVSRLLITLCVAIKPSCEIIIAVLKISNNNRKT